VLSHIDGDRQALADADQLEQKLQQLDARICDAEEAVGRFAIELLGLDLSPTAMGHLRGELTSGLQRLRDEKSRLETSY
jgi:hypothetical protein